MSIARAITKNGIVLGLFAVATTGLIASIYLGTKDQIAAAERAAEERQLLEIIPQAEHDNSMLDDKFIIAAETPLLEVRADRPAYRARLGQQVTGVILPATARDGYSGDIRILVGVYRSGDIAGVRVVSHKETPGLGDAVDSKKSDWILGFKGKSLQNPLPEGWQVKKDGGEFDQFTGATITPRAVVTAVRKALDYARLHRAELFETPTPEGES